MKKIVIVSLLGLFLLNSCGPSNDEKRQMRIERENRDQKQEERRIQKIHDKIVYNFEKDLINNKEKLKWNVSDISNIDDYHIENNTYGFLVTIEFTGYITNAYANGVRLNFDYDIIAKLKYDKNGNLIKAVSWEDSIH